MINKFYFFYNIKKFIKLIILISFYLNLYISLNYLHVFLYKLINK